MNRQIISQSPTQSSTPSASVLLQRKCDKCRKKKLALQRSAAGSVPDTMPPIVHDVLRSSSAPSDAAKRAFMEHRFGHDFSHIPVYFRMPANVQASSSVYPETT